MQQYIFDINGRTKGNKYFPVGTSDDEIKEAIRNEYAITYAIRAIVVISGVAGYMINIVV